MTTNRNSRRNSSWLDKLLSRRSGVRMRKKASSEFRRLSPAELNRIGLSKKSERYVEISSNRVTTKTTTLSKRQFYQKKLTEEAGRQVSLESRAREYLTGEREASTAAQAAARERSVHAWALRRKYKSERVSRIREHLNNMEIKARGDQLDWEVYLREKAFAEAHRDIPEEQSFFQKWFNYGHVKTAVRDGHDASRRSLR